MSSSNETSSVENDGAESDELADALDCYLDALHAGDANRRDELLRRFPGLESLAGCLENLEQLAFPGEGRNVAAAARGVSATAETVIVQPGEPNTGESSSAARLFETAGLLSEPPGQTPAKGTDRSFGRYELLEEVGRGGMGVVYKAWQTDLDRVVAIKMILSSQFASQEEVRRFYAEARAAGRLHHPNIIGIHEVGEVGGQHYFAMDYVEGSSLAEIVARGRVDAESAARTVASVARAVDYLHQHNVIHRDLKPSNILIDAEGTPYVTDFGLAKIHETDSQRTRTGTIVGTPSYMAPEQAAGRPSEVSPRSDVYSLGAILYEMLTGRPPFREANPLDTLVQVLEGEPSLPSRLNRRIPRELELICMRCLEKGPEQRYWSAAALADDLERFAKHEPIEARPKGVWPKLRRWGRREPALVSRLAAIFVALGIVQGRFFLADELFRTLHWNYHWKITAILGVWALVAFVFQKLLNREQMAYPARFGWAAADAILLTTLLCVADTAMGTLLVGYPLLIVASGLFFRVRLVWFTTLVCLVSFAALLLIVGRPPEEPPHYSILFAAVLAVLGFMVAHQVYRVRVLSRYYESRR